MSNLSQKTHSAVPQSENIILTLEVKWMLPYERTYYAVERIMNICLSAGAYDERYLNALCK